MAVGVAAAGLLAAGYPSSAAGQETDRISTATTASLPVETSKEPADSLNAVAGVPISATATTETRKIAADSPQAVKATSNLCGSGFNLQYAERLPDERRFGTLYTYQRNYSPFESCAVFDNNLGTRKYMKLKLCPSSLLKPCNVDEGNFTQYAGPVRLKDGWCSRVTAIMKDYKSSGAALIDRQFTIRCN
ncbi:hypothetical protein QCN29_23250 [Streptomyces sp. HNM0663]|uniref:Uncharacterized protein n=1 Tax=Streptomyces chengmaiensis TaxID=3040919 RepID=A0ABT6HSF2_9ACTN|nr:hypothetical protein [Streptomyces chengmaiensis]MDH2391642.1 hypothetical protein [Streptomyces chengmaiensis]